MHAQFPSASLIQCPSNETKSIQTSSIFDANNDNRERVRSVAARGDTEQFTEFFGGLANVSVEVAMISLRGAEFDSVLPDAKNQLDSRKYDAMKSYFADLMDRIATNGTSWTIISSAAEKRRYDKYAKVMEVMLREDLIAVKDGGSYRFDMLDPYCRSYRLDSEANRLFKVVTVSQINTTHFINKELNKKNRQNKKNTPHDLKYLEELILQLGFDHAACAEELRSIKVDQKLLAAYNADSIQLEDFLDKTLSKRELTGLFSFLRNLATQNISPSRSYKNGRISTRYISLPSRWRKHLLLNGVKIQEYDISSCHAAIWISKFAKDLSEKQILKNAFEDGRFYDLFTSDRASRNYVKKQFLSWINGDRGYSKEIEEDGQKKRVFVAKKFGSHPLDEIIAKVAPNFARLVRSIDIHGKYARSEFACLHQEWEAAIMVDMMLQWAEKNKLVYLPVHDGWLTIPEHAEQITEKVKALWLEHCEMKPKVVKYCS